MTLIHSSTHIETFFVNRGGQTLLITFNEMGMRANGTSFWGDGLAEKLGLSIAAFVSREPNWFPKAEMPAAVAALVAAAAAGAFIHRIAYGLSQGAYAALAYAKEVGATAVLAFSPQASIDPADIKDERFNRFFRPELHADMLPVPSASLVPNYVFYDPRDRLDAEHIALLRPRLPMIEIPLPFIGHSSAAPFARTETVRTLLACTVDEDRAGLAKLTRAARRRSTSRPYLICQALHERHPRAVLRIFNKYRDTPNSWWLVGRLLAMQGYGADVKDWMLAQCNRRPDLAELWACTAMALIEIQAREEAIGCIGKARRLEPENTVWQWVEQRAISLATRNPISGTPLRVTVSET